MTALTAYSYDEVEEPAKPAPAPAAAPPAVRSDPEPVASSEIAANSGAAPSNAGASAAADEYAPADNTMAVDGSSWNNNGEQGGVKTEAGADDDYGPPYIREDG